MVGDAQVLLGQFDIEPERGEGDLVGHGQTSHGGERGVGYGASECLGTFEPIAFGDGALAPDGPGEEHSDALDIGFDFACVIAGVVGAELHVFSAEDRRMSGVGTHDDAGSIGLLKHEKGEGIVHEPFVSDESISDVLRQGDVGGADGGWGEVGDGGFGGESELFCEPDSDSGLETAGEHFGDDPVAPPSETGMGMGGTEVDLVSIEADIAFEFNGGGIGDFGWDDEGIGTDHDGGFTGDFEGCGFDPNIVVNADGGFASAIAEPGEGELLELTGFGAIDHGSESGGEPGLAHAGEEGAEDHGRFCEFLGELGEGRLAVGRFKVRGVVDGLDAGETQENQATDKEHQVAQDLFETFHVRFGTLSERVG